MTETEYVETIKQVAGDYLNAIRTEPFPENGHDISRHWEAIKQKLSPHTAIALCEAWLEKQQGEKPRPSGRGVVTDNVVQFHGLTKLDLPAERIIEGAAEADLSDVVIVGYRKDGDFFFASSRADSAQVVWLLQRGIWEMNKINDRLAGEET